MATNERKISTENVQQAKSGEAANESDKKRAVSKEKVKSLTKVQSKDMQKAMSKEALKKAEEEIELKYGAIHVIQLFVPISICLMMVVFTVQIIPYYAQEEKQRLIYAPFAEDGEDDKQKLLSGLGNALIMMCLVVVTTFIIILLYKYRFYKLIHAWLFMSSMVILSFFTLTYVTEVLRFVEFPMDYITVLIISWNVCGVGLVAIHWKAPLRVQQGYLIYVSALLALIFIKFLPSWTTWIVLAFLVVWDLIAVLCPHGPLRMLVELAKERNEPIFPAMIYSSIVHIQIIQQANATSSSEAQKKKSEETQKEKKSTSKAASNTSLVLQGKKSTSKAASNTSLAVQESLRPSSTTSEDNTVAGIKLGLGDFIFYSVLVGKASKQNDWNTTIACFIAILVGLSLTLMLLAIFRKALPALPISLTFGLIFLSCTSIFVQPFAEALSEAQLYI